jgi:DNA excision repair protein ERCC-2
MMISSNKKVLFPHDKVREGQKELIEDLTLALKTGKVLIAHAPTGLGKTASALSVALEKAIDEKKKIFFLTNRHTQHKIAIDTVKLINKKTGKNISCSDMIGKRWMCNQDIANLFGTDFNEYCKSVVENGECEFFNNFKIKKELTPEAKLLVKEIKNQGSLHNEELIKICKGKKICSYEISLALAKECEVIVCDYYYLFNPFVQSTIFNKLDLELEDVILIVDEGHNLPGRVTEMLSSYLTTNMLKNGILEAKKFHYEGMISWLQKLNKIVNELAEFDRSNKERLVKKEEFVNKVKEFMDYDNLVMEMEEAAMEIRKKQRKSSLGGVAHFLQQWNGEDEGYSRIISEKYSRYGPMNSLSYSCLDPSLITKSIFDQIDSGIIMSGTLRPTSMYKDVLGIKENIEKEYPSPFPPENKLSMVVPQTSTKYTMRSEAMFQKMAGLCSEFIELIPGNVAFFFPSYDLRDKVGNFIESQKKLFWEKGDLSKEEKEVFLNDFKEEREKGGVLLGVAGANFAEGVDLPGDLLNGVIVVGLPLGKPDLKTKEIIKYYDNQFNCGWDYGYIFPAMSKCIQSAGRCIRSEKDKGAIIYLDERFAWQNYYSCLPREGLIVSNDFARMLKEFF